MAAHRLFVAIELPDSMKEQLALLRERLPGARWVPVEQLHLTLRFIGEIDDSQLTSVQESLALVNGSPFPLTLQGVGHFPPRRSPHVLWVGISAGPELVELYQQVEAAVQTAGLPAEERPFSPHITLARLRDTPPSAVAAYEQVHREFSAGTTVVTAFHLFESFLTTQGARHVQLNSFPLTAGNG